MGKGGSKNEVLVATSNVGVVLRCVRADQTHPFRDEKASVSQRDEDALPRREVPRDQGR